MELEGSLRLRAAFALIGEDLEPALDVCIEVEGSRITMVRRGGCPSGDYHRVSAATPLAANAHVHSADYLTPDYGTSLDLEELVSPPQGLKHRLLARAPRGEVVEASSKAYRLAEASGVGLILDFREPAAGGCRASLEASRRTYGVAEILPLGRPGDPDGPRYCSGVGLNSPLDHPEGLPEGWRGFSIISAHVAETKDARVKGDFEAAFNIGVNVMVHGVHLTRKDLEEAASLGAWLVMCPRSNLWHGTGVPPVKDAIEAGINVAVGTDNAAWSTPDPKQDAATLLYIARLQGARGHAAASWVLKALYSGGYVIAGRNPPAIREGYEAMIAVYTMPSEREWALTAAVDKHSAAIKVLAGEKPSLIVARGRCVAFNSLSLRTCTHYKSGRQGVGGT
ncbi:MAG: amidohydrolase family protein [Desulfurococcales archaeon]|nr:amidohydrolase family protein [Desulfurococcales archaeon]